MYIEGGSLKKNIATKYGAVLYSECMDYTENSLIINNTEIIENESGKNNTFNIFAMRNIIIKTNDFLFDQINVKPNRLKVYS
jgi:hypothetical protein